MTFLLRRLGHPKGFEEGNGINSGSSNNTQIQTDSKDDNNGLGTSRQKSEDGAAPAASTSGPSDYKYLSNFHWNTQTLMRLKAHERDYLSRNETQLLSCFAVHHGKKLIAFAEFSTELRVVTITVADIHAASEEGFTQVVLRRVRLNFIILPCIQHLTSDRGRREARDRRERHARRKQLLRRVAQWKAQKAELEQKRLETLRTSAATVVDGDVDGDGGSPAYSPSAELAHELRALRHQIDDAEQSLHDEQQQHPEEDSDFEGYDTEDLATTDEETQETHKKDGTSDESDSEETRHTKKWNRTPLKVSFGVEPDKAGIASDEAAPRASPRASPHHRQATANWTERTKNVKQVNDTTPGVKYAEDYTSADFAAGPPPPFIADHSKEELLFSRLVCVEWSRDGKYLAMVGDGPKYPLFVWEIANKEMIGSHRYMNAQCTRVDIRHNYGPLTVITMGPKTFKIWEIKTKFSEVTRHTSHTHTHTQPTEPTPNHSANTDRCSTLIHVCLLHHSLFTSCFLLLSITIRASHRSLSVIRNTSLISPFCRNFVMRYSFLHVRHEEGVGGGAVGGWVHDMESRWDLNEMCVITHYSLRSLYLIV